MTSTAASCRTFSGSSWNEVGNPLSRYAASPWKGDDILAAGRPLLGVPRFWVTPVLDRVN
ncbi:hypothetical protein EZI45_24320 [Delftia tsuruhatensis]|nr:hypothetical protein F3K36_29190 [Delftia sp. BR1]PZP69793.1 MAG: hypothetical protein DI604_17440 [Delftia acidovorans]TDF23780.1 hypothetical protein EZI45_24320 [Delftia tsuruhatensis]